MYVMETENRRVTKLRNSETKGGRVFKQESAFISHLSSLNSHLSPLTFQPRLQPLIANVKKRASYSQFGSSSAATEAQSSQQAVEAPRSAAAACHYAAAALHWAARFPRSLRARRQALEGARTCSKWPCSFTITMRRGRVAFTRRMDRSRGTWIGGPKSNECAG